MSVEPTLSRFLSRNHPLVLLHHSLFLRKFEMLDFAHGLLPPLRHGLRKVLTSLGMRLGNALVRGSRTRVFTNHSGSITQMAGLPENWIWC
jgi:hypothetical protein